MKAKSVKKKSSAKDKAVQLVCYLKNLWSSIKSWAKRRRESFRKAPWWQKILRVILDIIILFFIYLFLVDINFLWLFGKSPSVFSIWNPQQSTASEVYSSDGKLIGRYFRENRSPVTYDQINPMLVKTLIATEDERFYHHFGIDFKGLASAANDMAHGRARGASTITQQLVKNMFKTRTQYSTGLFGYIPGLSLLISKTKEWITAVKIETIYIFRFGNMRASKKEILTMYLNTVDFGCNAYGIKSAARTYFNTTPDSLKTEQCATLVGMLKATTSYNPKLNPKNSMRRRNVVLDNLYTHNIITSRQCDSLKHIPIHLIFKLEENYDGNALYFREAVANEVNTICKKQGIDVDLYGDGLKIYTTLDSRMQKYAENAVQKQMKQVQQNFKNHWGSEEPWRDENHNVIPHFIEDIAVRTSHFKDLKEQNPDASDAQLLSIMENDVHKIRVFDYDKGHIDMDLSTMDSIRYMEKFMHTGFMAEDPHTGQIRAWVGDINFQFWKYDKVTSLRQPGSTFKLFDYSAAFNQGLGPCDERKDEYIAWPYKERNKQNPNVIDNKTWIPRNANGNFSGRSMTLKCAFAQSVNTIAVKIAQEVGLDNIVRVARDMGIRSKLVSGIPSLCLGAQDVSLEDLVNSYCTAVNDGQRTLNGVNDGPILVTKIVDSNGKVLYEAQPEERQVIPYETAFLMVQMMKAGLTEPNGTSKALWGYVHNYYGTEFGGKTGTSSNHSDAWYVGATPNLVAGAWVGGEHRCIHFRTGALGQGSRTALPIVGYFFQDVLNDAALCQQFNIRTKFPGPKSQIARSYDCQTAYEPKVDTSAVLNDSTEGIEATDEINTGSAATKTKKTKGASESEDEDFGF